MPAESRLDVHLMLRFSVQLHAVYSSALFKNLSPRPLIFSSINCRIRHLQLKFEMLRWCSFTNSRTEWDFLHRLEEVENWDEQVMQEQTRSISVLKELENVTLWDAFDWLSDLETSGNGCAAPRTAQNGRIAVAPIGRDSFCAKLWRPYIHGSHNNDLSCLVRYDEQMLLDFTQYPLDENQLTKEYLECCVPHVITGRSGRRFQSTWASITIRNNLTCMNFKWSVCRMHAKIQRYAICISNSRHILKYM